MGGEMQQAFEEAIRMHNFEAQSYLDARALLNKSHWCRANSYPEELLQTAKNHADDRTVTDTTWGSAPCDIVGSLTGWNCVSELHNINVPTLLYHGEWDIDRHEIVSPYVEHVPGIRKITIQGASHMSHLENEDCQNNVLELARSFFSEK